jgi:hypothetical protein
LAGLIFKGDAALERKTNILKDYPDEVLLEEVRRVAEIVGQQTLTQADFTKNSVVSSSDVARRFGGWKATLERAGLGRMYVEGDEVQFRPGRKRIADEVLLEEIQRVAQLVEKSVLTLEDFNKNSKISGTTIALRFEGWHNALKQAGLEQMCFGTAERSAISSRINRKFTDEELLEEVRRMAQLVGKPVFTSTAFKKHSSICHNTLISRFGGNWRAVLERAGIENMYGMHFYSDEELLEEIRRIAQLIEKPPLKRGDIAKYSRVNVSSLENRFGSFKNVLERAGVGHLHIEAIEGAKCRYSDEELLEEIQRVAQLVGKSTLKQIEFRKYSKIDIETFRRRFRYWNIALELAGVGHFKTVRWPRGGYTDEELLEEIRRVARIVGKPKISVPVFQKYSKIDKTTITRRFREGWRTILKRALAGYMPLDDVEWTDCRYTDEELLEEIRRVAELVGKPYLLTSDFNKHSSINPNTISRRFGSWHNALDRLGIKQASCGASIKYTDEDLLDEVRRVAKIIGTSILKYNDFAKYSRIDAVTISKRLGGWKAALERAGVGHRCYQTAKKAECITYNQYTDEELLEEVRRVAQLVGKPSLSVMDFRRHTKIDDTAIRKRFGGWRNVLEQAGIGH